MKKQAKLELLMAYYKGHGFNFNWYQIERLQRIASESQRNAVNLCNIPDYKDKRDLLSNRMKKIFIGSDLGPQQYSIEGDPRGHVLKLRTKAGFEICPNYFNGGVK
jgi:hypothetical protein